MLQKLEPIHMQSVQNLEILDLSRNNIAVISDKTFLNSQYLRYLDLSVNVLRAVRFLPSHFRYRLVFI